MKRRDFEKHLRDHGCVMHHHGGRHDIWINPATQMRAPVPRHKEFPKIGLIRGICRQLGIPTPV